MEPIGKICPKCGDWLFTRSPPHAHVEVCTNLFCSETRKRFAWLPVRIWKDPKPFIERSRMVWLRPVVERWTTEGWLAYESDQEDDA